MTQQQKELLAARDYIQRAQAVLDKAGYGYDNPTMVELRAAMRRIDRDIFIINNGSVG